MPKYFILLVLYFYSTVRVTSSLQYIQSYVESDDFIHYLFWLGTSFSVAKEFLGPKKALHLFKCIIIVVDSNTTNYFYFFSLQR